MPILYFIRHGETDWNAQGRLQGRLQGRRDIGLNPRGEAQAQEAARRLRRLAPDLAALDFVASPLLRARRTMELMREALRLDPFAHRVEPDLAELSFGEWEGLTWPEATARDPVAAAAREADKRGFVPPGGESYAMLAQRIAPVFAAFERDAVVVSHGGVARAMLHLLCGLAPERAPHLDIWQGRVLLVQGGTFRWI